MLKQWFRKRVIEAMNEPVVEADHGMKMQSQAKYRGNTIGVNMPNDSNLGLDTTKCIRFHVYQANGGRVVETRRENLKNERMETSLYVVTSEQNFGDEIDKIITMEALKA